MSSEVTATIATTMPTVPRTRSDGDCAGMSAWAAAANPSSTMTAKAPDSALRMPTVYGRRARHANEIGRRRRNPRQGRRYLRMPRMTTPPFLIAAVALLILGVAFGLLERLVGRRGGPAWYRRSDTATDLAYWFFVPLVARTVTRLGVGLALVGVVVASGASLSSVRAEFASGSLPDLSLFGWGGTIRSWPIGWQIRW